jgi:PGF-CTERM protein
MKKEKEIFGIAIVVLFVVSILSGLFAPIVIGKIGRPEYPKDISDEFVALNREGIRVLMELVVQAEDAYACIPEAAYGDRYINREEAAYIGLVNEIEQEWLSFAMREIELAEREKQELSRRGYYGPPEELEEVRKELRDAYWGEDAFENGFQAAVFFVKYEGVAAYSYDPEASYEALERGKAHLEKAESLLPEGKIPTILPTLPPSEHAFNYQGEYKLDRNNLRPEESKALPFVMKYAKEHKVSPCLIMAVIRQESNFDVSANGGTDVGYMQITHDAAKEVGYKGTEQKWRQKDGLDPDQNIEYGTKYLKALNSIFRDGKLLTKDLKATKVPDKTERLKFVLAAYNGGQGRIAKAQQICEEKGDNPERWDDARKYLEAARATPEKAKIIRNYVEQVIEGRDFIDGQRRGYEFLLTIRIPVSESPTPEEGVPGFEAVFGIIGLLAVAYLLRRRK